MAAVSVYKTADNASINPGTNLGFTVTVNSSGTDTANGLSFTDNLPSGNGINWSLSSQTDKGWSISGSPPSQSLVFTPTSMPAGTSLKAHMISSTHPPPAVALFRIPPRYRAVTAALDPLRRASLSIAQIAPLTPGPTTRRSLPFRSTSWIRRRQLSARKFICFTASARRLPATTRIYDSNANTWTTGDNPTTAYESPLPCATGHATCYILGGICRSARDDKLSLRHQVILRRRGHSLRVAGRQAQPTSTARSTSWVALTPPGAQR